MEDDGINNYHLLVQFRTIYCALQLPVEGPWPQSEKKSTKVKKKKVNCFASLLNALQTGVFPYFSPYPLLLFNRVYIHCPKAAI